MPGHEFFVEVPEDFIEDDFNLTGLSTAIPQHYNEALDMILDLEAEEPPQESQMSRIEAAAEALYGLIHQRYIVTKQGLQIMGEKYRHGVFGVCPREMCGKAGVVPCGLTDQHHKETVKMFCPRCSDLYHPREAKHHNIDGAFFGTTFAHMLFLNYPELVPPLRGHRARRQRNEDDEEDIEDSEDEYEDEDDDLSDYDIYIPRIFGFRVSERCKTGPQMRWLRWKEGIPECIVGGEPLFGDEEGDEDDVEGGKVTPPDGSEQFEGSDEEDAANEDVGEGETKRR
ncbi:casein kinase 2 regulatory subunit [Borealophlyctis nickersoniae]|nr:casein kinase 2 regulatory subunit [Borealophlyctis nickersoniae]